MKKTLFSLLLFVLMCGLFACGSNEVEEPNIKVYTRDTTSGTRDGFFTTIDFKDATSDNTPLVKGYIEVAGNGDMISAIKNDEYAIGYISLSSLNTSGLKGLEYNNVDPNEGNVINGSYALTRNFNYVIRDEFDSEAERQITEAFIAYLNTKEGKATIKAQDGIVSINADDPSWEDIKAYHPIVLKDNSNITMKFGGSTSVENISEAITAEFSLKCGNFKYELNHTGSGDAFKRTQGSEKNSANKLHVGYASREFKLNDTELIADGTYGKICTDAIVAVVNSENKLTKITSEILKDIYSGKIDKWTDVK